MQTDKFTIVLTSAQLTIISEGLQLAPFGRVAPLVAEINRQLAEQSKPPTVSQETEVTQ